MSKCKDKRNAAILAERLRGDKLREIAARYGLSIQRVTEIIEYQRKREAV